MSDFISGFWAWYVTIIIVLSIVYCVWVLWTNGKTTFTPGETTGHVWDGNLQEINNPLPRWWVGLFWITIVFAIGYIMLYPTLGTSAGQLGWTSANQHAKEGEKLQAAIAPVYEKFKGMSVEELANDPKAQLIGDRLYQNFCAQCHGADARGSKSFPNLTDNDWLGDGSAEHIKNTIANGRQGMMPSMAAAVGGPDDVRNVAEYVLSLSGNSSDPVKAALGKDKFVACAACHGADGKGNPAVGAPNLTDNIWLHGFGADFIVKMINEGKTNIMPSQKSKLTDDQLHVLTGYVWGLSHKAAK
jgi:cytochrome c oxidase cbb3-type subunit 3